MRPRPYRVFVYRQRGDTEGACIAGPKQSREECESIAKVAVFTGCFRAEVRERGEVVMTVDQDDVIAHIKANKPEWYAEAREKVLRQVAEAKALRELEQLP